MSAMGSFSPCRSRCLRSSPRTATPRSMYVLLRISAPENTYTHTAVSAKRADPEQCKSRCLVPQAPAMRWSQLVSIDSNSCLFVTHSFLSPPFRMSSFPVVSCCHAPPVAFTPFLTRSRHPPFVGNTLPSLHSLHSLHSLSTRSTRSSKLRPSPPVLHPS